MEIKRLEEIIEKYVQLDIDEVIVGYNEAAKAIHTRHQEELLDVYEKYKRIRED